jgi:TonB family protein
MILNWMFASAIFAALVAVAAMLAERSLASAGKARRTPWLFALGVSTVWPLVAGTWFLLKPVQQPIAIIKTRIGTSAARVISEQFTLAPAWSSVVQRALISLWIAASILLLLRIVVALVRMRTVARESQRLRLDGTNVLVSETAGPAVCGAFSPQIVLPRWILELDAPLRSIVLRHEREHVERGDAAVVLGAALSVAFVPWSPAVWVMSRRLRLAVELDCDARVLARNEDPNRYGRLLMLVAQRQTHARLQPMLAESSAHLERRIREMNETGKKRSRLRATAFGTVAAGVVLLAGSSPVMAGITRPAQARSPLKYANEVLQLPAARTTVMEPPRSVQVKLQGQGQVKPPPPPPKVVLYNKGDSSKPVEFFEFTIDQQAGQAPNSQNPRYPDILRQAGIEGVVVVQFIVDRDSTVMDGSVRVLSSSHALFTQAVQNAMPNMRFLAATVKGQPVRQLVQQEFEFKVEGSGNAAEVVQYDTLRRYSAQQVRKLPNVRVTVPNLKKP